MAVSPDQLSLPLFDVDACEREERRSIPKQARLTEDAPAVVASHPQSRSSRTRPNATPTADSAPALLTTHEAAALLHVHPRTVQRLVERGQLEAVRLGTAVRFDPFDVRGLTERLKQPARAAAAQTDLVRPGRAGTSFADRLRHEHRAAQA